MADGSSTRDNGTIRANTERAILGIITVVELPKDEMLIISFKLSFLRTNLTRSRPSAEVKRIRWEIAVYGATSGRAHHQRNPTEWRYKLTEDQRGVPEI